METEWGSCVSSLIAVTKGRSALRVVLGLSPRGHRYLFCTFLQGERCMILTQLDAGEVPRGQVALASGGFSS